MISLVVAVAKNGVIGAKNDLPWYLPEDLKRFKSITNGHIVLMGRRTYESIVKRLGKPLPNRTNIVITRQTDYEVPPEVKLFASIPEALATFPDKDIFVIGGAEIFKETIGLADKIYMTHVERDVEGDVYFPEVDWSKWKLIKEEKRDGFKFADYERL